MINLVLLNSPDQLIFILKRYFSVLRKRPILMRRPNVPSLSTVRVPWHNPSRETRLSKRRRSPKLIDLGLEHARFVVLVYFFLI
jgi:hypothetical protein